MMYGARAVRRPSRCARFGAVYTLLARRYYIDEFYMWLIDKLVIGVGYALSHLRPPGARPVGNGLAALCRGRAAAAAHGADGPRPELRPGAVRRHGGHRLVLVIVPLVRP